MSKFKKKRGKAMPAISTASLPDIIFMLLFFFMVVTRMRDSTLQVDVKVPSATQLTKLEQKSLVNTIYVGRPLRQYQKLYGTAPQMQLGDKIATLDDIPLFLEQHKTKVNEQLHPRIMSSLKADGDITMGIISDLKTKLRKSGQLKVNYSARPAAPK